MIKVVFIDIDGTLRNSKKEITKHTKDIIYLAQNKGINIGNTDLFHNKINYYVFISNSLKTII